uniref:Uncharacterized protein n=1 Tax=Biomphalaria glabrata TaxID=6526 RepID=A0A2C9LKL2_BIOGL
MCKQWTEKHHDTRTLSRLKVGGYHNRHVLVTGCDSGFGQRTVIKLDNLGFKVFAGCLTEDGKKYLSQNCSKSVVPFLLDVRSNESIQSALDLVKQHLPENTGLRFKTLTHLLQ